MMHVRSFSATICCLFKIQIKGSGFHLLLFVFSKLNLGGFRLALNF